MENFKAPPRDFKGGMGREPRRTLYCSLENTRPRERTGSTPLAMAVGGQNPRLWERSSKPGPVS